MTNGRLEQVRVVLIGMAGSGKTTTGRALGAQLGVQFADTDDVVVAHAGRSVAEIFSAEGEEGFRARELAALVALTAEAEPQVVATGGGIITTENARAHLAHLAKQGWQIVWLRTEARELVSRLAVASGRPLFDADPAASVPKILGEREALYERCATCVVDTTSLEVTEVVDAVAEVVSGQNHRAQAPAHDKM